MTVRQHSLYASLLVNERLKKLQTFLQQTSNNSSSNSNPVILDNSDAMLVAIENLRKECYAQFVTKP